MQHLLVFRFSALGDVALSVPVLKALLNQNPDLKITLVSRPQYKNLFRGLERLSYFEADFSKDYKGIPGLFKLSKALKKSKPIDAVFDLHDVIRTKVLRKIFQWSGCPVYVIDKGRKEKKALTRKHNKVLKPLKHTVFRYADVFKQAGFNSDPKPPARPDNKPLKDQFSVLKLDPKRFWVGLAPFAKHKAKQLPIETIRKLIDRLSKEMSPEIVLFGAGQEEFGKMDELVTEFRNLKTCRNLTFAEELDLMKCLDLMISMDSANMHLASLSGIPVVSVWGATHRFSGFLGFGQKEQNTVEISTEELSCRPCSVYGNKPCYRKDYACLNRITPDMILDKIKHILA